MIGLVDQLVVPGLTEGENEILNACLGQLRAFGPRNVLRARYYDSEQTTKHLGISVPPQLERVENVIGLPAKAVNTLGNRIDLDGLVIPGSDMESFGLDAIWSENRWEVEATQAHVSALKYGCGFIAVMAGGPGEPDVVMRNLSALSSTALWDANRRRASAALTVISSDAGYPTEFILFLDYAVVTGVFEHGRWAVDKQPHSLGRCPVAVLPFQPSVERPLGRSKITRGVMSLTDEMVRTILRMEVGAEFYTAPRSVIMGADPSIFTDESGEPLPAWSAYMSKVLTLPLNEIDEKPDIKSLPQMSMQPHIEMRRDQAARFSAETNIPIHLLGIVHDNPASDAAMHTTYLELNKEAQRAQHPFGFGHVDAFQMAWMVREGASVVPGELRRMRGKFRDVADPLLSASSDAAMKLISSGVLAPDSEVVLEMLDFDDTTIERVKSERRRAQGGSVLEQLVAAGDSAVAPDVEAEVQQANAMRAKLEALGVGVRAGATFESLVQLLGLTGVESSGAMPVSLRLPEAEARALEDGTGPGGGGDA